MIFEITKWVVGIIDSFNLWCGCNLSFLKYFKIVVVDTRPQALVSMHIASRMLNLRMALLLSKAIMMRRVKMVPYFVFRLRTTLFRFSRCRCAGQWSMIITIFHPSWWNWLSNTYSHFSKSCPLVQLFASAQYRHGKCLIP